MSKEMLGLDYLEEISGNNKEFGANTYFLLREFKKQGHQIDIIQFKVDEIPLMVLNLEIDKYIKVAKTQYYNNEKSLNRINLYSDANILNVMMYDYIDYGDCFLLDKLCNYLNIQETAIDYETFTINKIPMELYRIVDYTMYKPNKTKKCITRFYVTDIYRGNSHRNQENFNAAKKYLTSLWDMRIKSTKKCEWCGCTMIIENENWICTNCDTTYPIKYNSYDEAINDNYLDKIENLPEMTPEETKQYIKYNKQKTKFFKISQNTKSEKEFD